MYPTSQEQLIQLWIVASILGLIPAAIAYRKGRSFGLWWIYGAMLFIVALFHSLLIKPKMKAVALATQPPVPVPEPGPPEGTKKCPYCDQLMDALSANCPVCKREQPA